MTKHDPQEAAVAEPVPGPIGKRRNAADTGDKAVVDPADIVIEDASVTAPPQADAGAIAAGLPFRTDPSKVLEHDPVAAGDPQPVAGDAGDAAARERAIEELEVKAKGSGPEAEAAKATLRSLRHNGIRTDAQAIALDAE